MKWSYVTKKHTFKALFVDEGHLYANCFFHILGF